MIEKELYSLSNSERSYIRLAIRSAYESDLQKRHGAVLVKSGKVIAVANNTMKTTPFLERNFKGTLVTLHAEMNVFQGFTAEELRGTSLYVIRLGRKSPNLLLNSQPCSLCSKLIFMYPLKKVIFSGDPIDNQEIFYKW